MPNEQNKRPPYCWVSKEVLRAIREAFEENRFGETSSGIALMTALAEIASDKGGSDTFTVSQAAIAKKAGLSDRTLRSIMPLFEKIRLHGIPIVTIKRNVVDGMQKQSTYTLNHRVCHRAEIISGRAESNKVILFRRKKNI